MKRFLIAALLLMAAPGLRAQEGAPTREYALLGGAPDEVQIFAVAGLTLNKAFTDLYQRAIGPRLSPGLAPWVETAWAINWGFVFTMWPHDGGHWARAQQVGGDFVITAFGYPFPTAEMRLPAQLARKDRTLTSIGGHEVNFLMRRQVHRAYYEQQYVFADEMIHAFIQDVFYPFYAFILGRADPTDPGTWTDTWGDPVEHTLSVFQTFTGREPVRTDGSVDPALVDQYRETTLVSVIWPLLSPIFYRGLRAFSVDRARDRGIMEPPWMLGSERLAWSWGTHFHPSPLGYELHLENYFRVRDRLLILTLRAGRPHRNLGAGLSLPDLLASRGAAVGISADVWDQALFGTGGSVTVDARYRSPGRMGLLARAGWKTEGYLVGRRVDASPLVLVGLSYRF